MTADANWSKAEMHVLKELDRLSEEVKGLGGKIDCIDKKVSNLRVEVARHSAVWGAISGAVVGFFGWWVRR